MIICNGYIYTYSPEYLFHAVFFFTIFHSIQYLFIYSFTNSLVHILSTSKQDRPNRKGMSMKTLSSSYTQEPNVPYTEKDRESFFLSQGHKPREQTQVKFLKRYTM